MSTPIKDFVVQLGFDGKAALASLANFEKRVTQVAAKLNALTGQNMPKSSGAAAGGIGGNAKDIDKERDSTRGLTQAYIDHAVMMKKTGYVTRSLIDAGLLKEAARYEKLLDGIAAEARQGKRSQHEFNKALREAEMEFSLVSREMRRAQREMQKTDALTRRFTGSLSHMATGFASVYVAYEGLRNVMRIGGEMESAEAGFKAITGSAETAAAEMLYAQNMALQFGMGLDTATDSWMKFMAAGKTMNDSGTVRELFEGVTQYTTVLGLSNERVKYTFLALQQMMSKGKISAEELRRQLGEHLPGAVNDFANALGISTAELNKQMESGQLLSADVLPKVAKYYKDLANNAGALEEKLSGPRMQIRMLLPRLQVFAKRLYDLGVAEGVANMFKDVSHWLDKSTETSRGLAHAIRWVLDLAQTFLRVGLLLASVAENIYWRWINIYLGIKKAAMEGNVFAEGLLWGLQNVDEILLSIVASMAVVKGSKLFVGLAGLIKAAGPAFAAISTGLKGKGFLQVVGRALGYLLRMKFLLAWLAVEGIQLLIENWDTITEKIKATLDWVKQIMDKTREFMRPDGSVGNAVKDAGNMYMSGFPTPLASVSPPVMVQLNTYVDGQETMRELIRMENGKTISTSVPFAVS